MSRLSEARLHDITGYTRKSAQVRWFRLHLGVEVPCDRFGPIMTDEAYEKLLEKRLGLVPSSLPAAREKPAVRLVKG